MARRILVVSASVALAMALLWIGAFAALQVWMLVPVHGTFIGYFTPNPNADKVLAPEPLPLYYPNPPAPAPRAHVRLSDGTQTDAAVQATGLKSGAPVTLRRLKSPGAVSLVIASSP